MMYFETAFRTYRGWKAVLVNVAYIVAICGGLAWAVTLFGKLVTL